MSILEGSGEEGADLPPTLTRPAAVRGSWPDSTTEGMTRLKLCPSSSRLVAGSGCGGGARVELSCCFPVTHTNLAFNFSALLNF